MYHEDGGCLLAECKMDQRSVCHACLVSGRTMRPLFSPQHLFNDYWKHLVYVQILSDDPISPQDQSAFLVCWECNARIESTVIFLRQVKEAQHALKQLAENPTSECIIRAPRLSTTVVEIHSLPPESVPLKYEVDWYDADSKNKIDISQVEVKVEIPNSPENFSFTASDDEDLTSLIRNNQEKRKREKASRSSYKKKKNRCYALVVISESQMIKERTELENSPQFQSSKFKCDSCLLVFKDEDTMNKHNRKHGESRGRQRCEICTCRMTNAASLRFHERQHYRRYKCLRCNLVSGTKRQAIKHYRACTSGSSIRTNGPTKHEEVFEDTKDEGAVDNKEEEGAEDKNLLNSSSACPVPGEYECHECNKVFRWKASLRKHSEQHRIQAGETVAPYCEPCRLSFVSSSTLHKHLRSSSKHKLNVKLKSLKSSPDAHAQATQLAEALKQQLSRFPCPHCERVFQWKGNLNRHVQSHKARANGELVCEPCNKKFSSIATYQQHLNSSKKHVTENDFRYMCSDCGNRFANKRRLREHVDWEHLKIFCHVCTVCDKAFKSQASLYLHNQTVHRPLRTLCDHCGKPFANPAKLRTHMAARHSAEQPYKCKMCTATFSWHSCLSRHVKVVHEKVKIKRKRKGKDETTGELPPVISQ